MPRSVEELIRFSVININKPSGPLSKEIDERIRRLFDVKRVGHAGTLDPKASGVLLIALEEATKILKILMKSDKEYEGVMHLHNDIEQEKIEQTIREKFLGRIIQTPPVHSRVARVPRKREVYSFEILEKNGKNVKFKAKVEAGTYIRKLCFDLGEELGTGAHMKYLKRTKSGKFIIEHSHDLKDVQDAYDKWESGNYKPLEEMLIPLEDAINVKKIVIRKESVQRIRNGSPVRERDMISEVKFKQGEDVLLVSETGRPIGLGIAKSKFKIKTDRIFIG